MTEAAKNLLIVFESLPVEDRREVAVEILRRESAEAEDEITEDELVQAADRVFLELDRGETAG
jgi:hypothetical protein